MFQPKPNEPPPFTLFVEKFDCEPKVDFRATNRQSILDIEMNTEDVKKLVAKLTERLESTSRSGAMRIRFIGHMVL